MGFNKRQDTVTRITNSSMMPKKLSWIPMDAEWRGFCAEKFWGTQYRGDIPYELQWAIELRDKLLTFGGDEACMPAIDPDYAKLMARGQFWYGDSVELIEGNANQCHMNSAQLWNENRDICSIATGYALSDDGMWRQHSWVIRPMGDDVGILETTSERIGYYGFILNPIECDRFLMENGGDQCGR